MLQPLLSHRDNGQQETLLQHINVKHDFPGKPTIFNVEHGDHHANKLL